MHESFQVASNAKLVVIRSVYRDDRFDSAMALSFLSIPDGVSADARTVRHLAGDDSTSRAI